MDPLHTAVAPTYPPRPPEPSGQGPLDGFASPTTTEEEIPPHGAQERAVAGVSRAQRAQPLGGVSVGEMGQLLLEEGAVDRLREHGVSRVLRVSDAAAQPRSPDLATNATGHPDPCVVVGDFLCDLYDQSTGT